MTANARTVLADEALAPEALDRATAGAELTTIADSFFKPPRPSRPHDRHRA